MAEIYKQEIIDLFKTTSDQAQPMWIKEDGSIHGITLLTAKNAEELKKAFDLGIQKRKVSYTDANDNSSRSHLLFAFLVKRINKSEYKELNETGHCIFVDLAGTETNQQTGFN